MNLNPFEQLKIIRDNIHEVHEPEILFAINQKYRELEQQAESIKRMTVYVCAN